MEKKDETKANRIIGHCSWCRQNFHSQKEFESHLVNGKTINPRTGKLRRFCPWEANEKAES
jgi:hypothetical protein